ncbi:NAD(P)/FAD-dependent oxidoreductase [Emcibacter nanhaiensis]|uniref:Pyridine nucleotide-disulfide oxidoreductase n=1 Tax=Emcibacter nanhaiensis TaxID=1505037 RepID=A0A501PAJ0_9PROT|nr:FAD-dependent oxidoreductase [Emcibacter nanhaiensis]TPD57380.1 pyridine nucleotide-disulfide oxidoreductase [Emcibacter nanhaiensis]
MSETVLIIGAGHGCAQAVASLRSEKFEGKIVVVGDEDYIPYQRPPLSKDFLKGDLPLERLYIKPQKFYDDRDVEMKTGVRVTKIDPAGKTADLDNGESVSWDHLIIATGSHVRKLTCPGHDLGGVHYLRTVADVHGIQADFDGAKDVVVVGGGYIGLEIAAVARQKGKNVTVLEMADRILNRVVAPEMSAFYQRVHEEEGVKILCNTGVTALEGDGGKVSRVLTGDGQAFDADLVVVGIGIVPAQELAEAAGIELDNGIKVDEHCRTSAADVFAIGDVTSHPSPLYGRRIRLESVPNAMGQAKITAKAIMGTLEVYDEIPWFWSDQFDMKLQIAGLSAGYDQIVIRGDLNSRSIAAFYLKDGVLIAMDGVNRPAEFMASKKLITMKAKPDPDKLADPDVNMKEFL